MQFMYTQLKSLEGWRRWLLSLFLGCIGAGCMAPFYAVFLLIPVMTGLLWLVYSCQNIRSAFVIGWFFGFGHFSIGFYWVANALLVDPDRFGWLAPFAVFVLSALIALFPAFCSLIGKYFERYTFGAGRVVFFASVWCLFEWFRGWIFTGFPWNLLGSIWVFSDEMIQCLSLMGVFGLSLLSVLVAGMPAILSGDRGWRSKGKPFYPICFSFLILASVWMGGKYRIMNATNDVVSGVSLRLVQPNIDQKLKWQPLHREKNFREQIHMGVLPPEMGLPRPTHIFWSETAATYFVDMDIALRKAIAKSTPRGGLTIIGAPRTNGKKDKNYKVWNSLHAIDEVGDVVGTYDKFHLVPFGEYTPFQKIIKFEKLTVGATNFSPGYGPRTLRLKGLPPVSPLICYEVIFPANVVDSEDRPDWMLNLTNDGWYGLSSGPYQHFDAARMRAVEEGLPLVRVANTGISGVIDGYGRVITMLALGSKGIIDTGLPRPLEPTLFSRFRNAIVIFLIILVAVSGILLSIRDKDFNS